MSLRSVSHHFSAEHHQHPAAGWNLLTTQRADMLLFIWTLCTSLQDRHLQAGDGLWQDLQPWHYQMSEIFSWCLSVCQQDFWLKLRWTFFFTSFNITSGRMKSIRWKVNIEKNPHVQYEMFQQDSHEDLDFLDLNINFPSFRNCRHLCRTCAHLTNEHVTNWDIDNPATSFPSYSSIVHVQVKKKLHTSPPLLACPFHYVT